MSLRPRSILIAVVLVLVLVLVTVAGCGSARHASHESDSTGQVATSPMGAAARTSAGPGSGCGTVKSASDVSGTVMVRRGQVDCAAMRQVLTVYYGDLASGRAPGNGGGGPVVVQGWRCVSGPATAPGTTCTKATALVTVGFR
jgi:hypothetical protein